jgi:5-methyltetrahydrofolate--homocysteine methyltransferase
MACDSEKLLTLVKAAVEDKVPAETILNDGLIKGMDVVGEKMGSGDMFIPEVLMAAKAMSVSVEYLKPMLAEGSHSSRGTIVIGTVKGDLHDIGKNLVSMMLESAGFSIVDLGVDVPEEKFVGAVKEKNAKLLCLSALLTTTMPIMKSTIQALVEAGLKDRVKIMVGGAPVTQKFADDIQADGYADDAGGAVKLAKKLTESAV